MDSVRGPEIRLSIRSIRCGAVDINKEYDDTETSIGRSISFDRRAWTVTNGL
jgi:hypothetical protein